MPNGPETFPRERAGVAMRELLFSGRRSLLVEAEHAATQCRVIVLLRPPVAVSLDSEPTARRLELVEVDPAALIPADKFDPVVVTMSQLVTPAVRH